MPERATTYLCLAYGDGKDWNALTTNEQDALLAPDEVLRKREDLVPNRPCTRAKDAIEVRPTINDIGLMRTV